jgi:hypothetical protein
MSDEPFEPVCRPPRRLVAPVRVDPSGRQGPTRGQARGRQWRRVGKNAYVPSDVDRSVPEQRVVESGCHVPPTGAVTGWGALRLWRAAYFDGRGPAGELVPVLIATGGGSGRAPHEDVEYTYEPLDPAEVVLAHGLRITTPLRALFDEMRRRDGWRRSVVAFDMAAAGQLVRLEQMRDYLAAHRSWRRSTQVARALDHASTRSRSPAETRLRLVWVLDARLPAPLVNQEVFDLNGRLVCIADLFDPVAGMVAEYDGAEHRRAARHSRDVAREEACRRIGLEYCKVTGPDLRDRAAVVERLRSCRSRALFLEPAARAWTLQPRAAPSRVR